MTPPPAQVPGPQPRRRHSTDVLVVGAGPTGLMAGAWCAKLGVQALVVDGKSGPTRESRALGLQSRSLEVYRQLGLDQAVLDGSTPAATVSPGFGHRTLGTLHLDRVGHGLTPFPGITIFEQSANEELLAGFLAQRRRPVAWGTSFHSFADPRRPETTDAGPGSPGGPGGPGGPGRRVTARLETPEGPVLVNARYVVAADGASSPVRRALGIAFEGSTNAFEFFVLDAHGVTGTESGVMVRASREHFMLAFPLGDDGRGGRRARLLGILRAEDRPAGPTADARDEARARASLAEEFGIRYAGTAWYSTYRVHHRVAAAFRAGPVFLAGDAAHIHSPVGAQGMNTGLQDAQNIVCKIADVLTGRDTAEAIERYEAERRPVALKLMRTTDVVFGAVTSLSVTARLLRTRVFPMVAPALLRLVPRLPAGGRLFGYISQIRIHYWMPGTEAGASGESRGRRRRRGRVLGRRLPWVPDAGRGLPEGGGVAGADNHEDLTAAVWQVHAYGPAAVDLANDLAERHREKAAGPGGPSSDTGEGLPVLPFRAAPEAGLPDGTALLVRPDGFVAALESADPPAAGERRKRPPIPRILGRIFARNA
ncbi:FAD-dependent monooxygenase [Microbacterium sp. A93]|uniref:FAD-dependent monooxygenase n=1 Tax=Microbacterium sp. A93 TaxID=3450716 RepID=UPI003F432BE5